MMTSEEWKLEIDLGCESYSAVNMDQLPSPAAANTDNSGSWLQQGMDDWPPVVKIDNDKDNGTMLLPQIQSEIREVKPEPGGYTEIKSKPHYSNSDSAFVDVKMMSAEEWEFEIDLGFVNYSAMCMDQLLSSPSTDTDNDAPWMQQVTDDDWQSIVKMENSKDNGTMLLPQIQCEIPEVKPEPAPNSMPQESLKRPRNGFIRYAMRFRKEVAKAHPRLNNRSISRILGVQWRKLLAKEKMNYEQEFREEMQTLKADHPQWQYSREKHKDVDSWEPSLTRLRPRDKLKQRKMTKLTRPYTWRKPRGVIQIDWVQCDRCNKWRQLPYGVNINSRTSQWFCEYNRPPKNHCDTEEDQEDSDEELLTQQLNNMKGNINTFTT